MCTVNGNYASCPEDTPIAVYIVAKPICARLMVIMHRVQRIIVRWCPEDTPLNGRVHRGKADMCTVNGKICMVSGGHTF